MSKKLLITGGSGLLGGNIAKTAQTQFDVFATYFTNSVSMEGVNFIHINLTKKEQISIVKEINPDYIIHCAALTNVDYAQAHEKEAYLANVVASNNIAEVAKKIGAYLIFISTDSVFDGLKGNYNETDKPNPINIYGKTKLEAEKEILKIYAQSLIVRTNIYGWNKRNKFSLAEWMINKFQANEKFPAFKDVYFTPILVNDLARILLKFCKVRNYGIFHIGGSERCSKLDFAKNIAKIFEFETGLIKPTSIDHSKLNAPRGKDTSLNVSKAEKRLNTHFPNVDDGLKKMKTMMSDGYLAKLKS